MWEEFWDTNKQTDRLKFIVRICTDMAGPTLPVGFSGCYQGQLNSHATENIRKNLSQFGHSVIMPYMVLLTISADIHTYIQPSSLPSFRAELIFSQFKPVCFSICENSWCFKWEDVCSKQSFTYFHLAG